MLKLRDCHEVIELKYSEVVGDKGDLCPQDISDHYNQDVIF